MKKYTYQFTRWGIAIISLGDTLLIDNKDVKVIQILKIDSDEMTVEFIGIEE